MNASTGVSNRPAKTRSFSDQEIRQIAKLNSNEIAEWAHSTACQRGISVRRMPNHRFLKAVSRLSDGVIDLDPVEELLVALGRAGVITSFQRGLLQIHYLH